MKCPKCDTEISAVYSVPPEQQFRYSITLKEDQAMLHAETLGGSITAMRKLLCAIAKQTGQEVEVFIKGIEYGNPINIDFVILHKAKKSNNGAKAGAASAQSGPSGQEAPVSSPTISEFQQGGE